METNAIQLFFGMNMHSSQLSDLEKILGNMFWTFSEIIINSENSEFSDDSDMSSKNINRPISSKMKKTIALMMKR